jgi:superfamily II DNA or RNA helicase
MACKFIPNNDTISSKVCKDLSVKIEMGYHQKQTKVIYILLEEEDGVKVPFYYGLQLPDIIRPNRSVLGKISHSFVGKLREQQKQCRDDSLVLLQQHKSCMLCCYTGFGKTITAINMACKIKLKTLITVPKKPLLSQWESEIKKFVPNASVMVVEPGKIKNIENATDFCIVNTCNVQKLNKDFLQQYGFVIVDEAHLQMTEKLSENLLYLTPRYLLGVTATPYRKDGYHPLFKLFFGENKVQYSLNKKHTVYKVKTGFRPNENNYLKHGPNNQQKVCWNTILDEQAKNEKRNNIIIDIVRHEKFKDRVFLILVKRIEHGQYLFNCLENLGEKVTSLLGKQQEFDKEARILIGTNSKIGTGFDHPKLDTLLAAADMVSYYIQFIGRVMRKNNNSTIGEPIIFDLVDSHPILKKHFEKRLKVYSKHGGEVVDFNKMNKLG